MRIKNHIKSAVGNLSQHKGLSHDLLITNDFGQITPVCAIPLLPRDKMKIRTSVFSRVAPMIFPTYGRCEIVTNFHMVQYNQIWKDFDDFVTGLRTVGVNNLYFPVIRLSHIESYFLGVALSKEVTSSDGYDIRVATGDSSSPLKYYQLTLFGRYVRKILVNLGYPMITYINNTLDSSDSSNSSSNIYFSALPLMSYVKVYSDFYESRQYAQTSVLREILNQCYRGQSGSYWTQQSDPNYLVFDNFTAVFDNIRLLYPSDYFTSAQAYPNLVGGSQPISVGPLQNSSDPFILRSPLKQGSASNDLSSVYPENLTTSEVVSSAGTGALHSFQPATLHRLLDNFENYIRRFNLVGSRQIDRIRAQFGVRPSVASNQYSLFLGGFKSPLQVQDVTSTSAEPDVDNYLGSYAGKGIVSDGGTISVDSDDFGMLIGLSFLKVSPLYQPGLNREVLKTNFMSYYNPDFDHGYSMAIALGEMRPVNADTSETAKSLLQVFGYQNAYDEYRKMTSRISGDFIDTDLHPWSFARRSFGSVAQSADTIYMHQPSSRSASDMYEDFQEIFVDGSGRDHFYLYYSFDIDALRPVRTSSESFDLGVGNVTTANNPVI